MRQGFFTGLSKVINVGTAYLQHAHFVERALQASQSELSGLLVQYTQGLSDTSFAGFKVTLVILASKEQKAQSKRLIQSLLESVDAARGSNLTPTVVDEPSTDEQSEFDRDLHLMHEWHSLTGHADRVDAVRKHVIGMDIDEFKSFVTNLKQMRDNVIEQKKQHEDNEDKVWGGFMEDRMAYRMAHIQTGQRDPTFVRELEELQEYLNFIEWLIKVSINLMEAHVKQVLTATNNHPSVAKSVDSNDKVIMEAMRKFTTTGQYPGGADQMQKDAQAMIEIGRGDEVIAMFKAMGANESGNKILNMMDYYCPSDTLFELLWTLGVTLPVGFDELDHETQYSVLCSEWTRREMEGSYMLQQGDAAGAQAVFEECLARAQQLGVSELLARSYEGLARVASHIGARVQERASLKAAMFARGIA